jgi:enamine deaminase RidA (YjgF/YER057c/UK114 family)
MMFKFYQSLLEGKGMSRLMLKLVSLLGFSLFVISGVSADVTRYPLPGGSTFPISQAVEVTSGSIVFLSGTTPAPADTSAKMGEPAYYGDTKTQTISALNRIKQNLEGIGLDMTDIIKLQVFLVGDPAMDNIMDRDGFMEGYVQFFGTAEQPNLPSRSAFQIARLGSPLMFIEIEATAVRN